MLNQAPSIRLPDALCRILSVPYKNKKQAMLEVCQIIESDKFLSLYTKNTFAPYFKNGGVMTLLGSMGMEKFRDLLTEAYLYQYFFGGHPGEIELDLVQDVLDFERRFESLRLDGSFRNFQLGLYLKMINLFFEKNNLDGQFILIPVEVDEILAVSRMRPFFSDWLIIITWGLVDILGAAAAKDLLLSSQGKINRIERELSLPQQESWAKHCLKYGFAINDDSMFATERV